jgi:hypothetical protein
MSRRPHPTLRIVSLLASMGVLVGLISPAGAASAGFTTAHAPMLNPVIPRAWVDPIITVGDTIGGYMFEAIPDGIAVRKDRRNVEVYVNHETSTVPFPYSNDPNATPPTSPTQANSQNDFRNAELSRLIVSTRDASISDAAMVITSDQGFQRFCSNFLAGREHGFSRELLLTNEEAVDWVKRSGPPYWPATEGAADARQSGVVVAYDPKTRQSRPIWGMGRHNHENSVAVPGYRKPVVVSGDDTFVNSPAQSQMFMYIAQNADAVWNDTGDLWAFVADGPFQEYGHFDPFAPPGSESTAGHFIKVPKFIATGIDPATGADLMSARAEVLLGVPAGTYAPPTNGSFSRPPGQTTGPSVDGPQWVLERWSQLNGVFKFIRLEDIAYDKRRGMSNVLYVVDSGRGSAPPAVPGKGTSTNGRIWKMVLDKKDPTKVTSLSILIEGDDNPVKTVGEIHQPDNIESTRNGLYITEDPGSSQQFNYTADQLNDGRRTEARIWQYRFDGTMRVAFKVDQSADEGPTDEDPAPSTPGAVARGNLGAWEASGIVDVSEWFGPGTFLVTVQAHTLFVDVAPGLDVTGDGNPDILNKREGGQLLLVHIPGG